MTSEILKKAIESAVSSGYAFCKFLSANDTCATGGHQSGILVSVSAKNIFPSQEAYHDLSFATDELVLLAAKTTCKDRWRQVLNEANRLRGKDKFLCTLQQGVSPAQMDEMQEEQVILVVPKPYISCYPKDRQDRIWTISRFVKYVKEIQKL